MLKQITKDGCSWFFIDFVNWLWALPLANYQPATSQLDPCCWATMQKYTLIYNLSVVSWKISILDLYVPPLTKTSGLVNIFI